MTTETALPVDALLPELIEALRKGPAALLSAPPGAGKTTRVPPALLAAGIAPGQIVLLQPRRLAARAVAAWMARQLGEPLGETVGYKVRFDERVSPRTRILVVTEGILTRRLLADPLLEGVGCVIQDEFHQRSVDADLCLAFLREVQELRQDLKLLIMSATLQAQPLQDYLGGCPHLRAEVRGHPLRVRHLAAPDRRPLAARVRSAVASLLAEEDDDGGDVLVFLPGAGEIRAALRALEEPPLPGAPTLVPLYGALAAAEQDRALEPGPRRRVVLATNIAETSLTVPGVTAVVDSGLVKRLRYDPRLGLDRLELGHISASSAAQRAGRAGRLAPGRVLRLWSAADQAGLPEAETPEIRRTDSAPMLLAVLAFHPGDPSSFPFFEAPPGSQLQAGLSLLRRLGALSKEGFRLSERGRRLARLPLHPRLGALLDTARDRGLLEDGALLAALLGERDLLGGRGRDAGGACSHDSDLLHRRDLLLELRAGGFSESAARRLGVDRHLAREVQRASEQLLSLGAGGGLPRRSGTVPDRELLRLVAAAYPDRVCRRRAPGSSEAVMAGGRGVRLSEESGVREAELFVALEAEAGRPGLHAAALVRQASAVDEELLGELFPDELRREHQVFFDERRGAVQSLERRLFDDLVLGERVVPAAGEQASRLLAESAARRFSSVLRSGGEGQQLIARLRLAGRHLPEERWPDASEDGLRALLPALCVGRHSLEELGRLDWSATLLGRLDHRQRGLLDRELPERWQVPSGSRIAIDYAAGLDNGAGPVLAVKLQELFGLAESPRLARGALPLTLHLLGPNGRPVQVTQDLRSFWQNGYPEVRRALRGRYPKHPWPEDPWTAVPTARAKRRGR